MINQGMFDAHLVLVLRIAVCLLVMITTLPILVTFIFFPNNKKAIHFDVYLVLGAAPTKDGLLSRMMRSRMDEVIRQYQFYPRPIIISGGTPHSNVSEARIMAAYAMEKGIKASHILLEEKANSTYENYKYAVAILEEHRFKRCCIVTNDFHLRRACFFAKKFGLMYMCAPTSLRGYFKLPYRVYMIILESFLRIKCIVYEFALSLRSQQS